MADKIWLGTDSSTPTDWNTAANWSPSGVPSASDNVRLVASYSNNLAGYDASGTALADFIVEDGYSGTIGSKTADLQISCTYFEFAGSGLSYIDLGSSSVSPRIVTTGGTAGAGRYSLYLIGTAISVISVEAGSVGLAAVHGQASTITTVRQRGGTVKVGAGAALTNLTSYGGTSEIATDITTVKVYGGTVTTSEQAAVTTATITAGTLIHNGTGAITTATIDGGELDLARTGAARTITTLNLNPGGGLKYDPDAITITNNNTASAPISILSSAL
tara:strand:+ start:2242 stop:3066 length:825 start_codon:yes stop_codon:yes gene_type:complete